MRTKSSFVTAYEQALKEMYPWAREDPEKLARFMMSVRATVFQNHSTWNTSGSAVENAWKAIGGPGKFSLKKLRSLPHD
jgi:hypothetical protein